MGWPGRRRPRRQARAALLGAALAVWLDACMHAAMDACMHDPAISRLCCLGPLLKCSVCPSAASEMYRNSYSHQQSIKRTPSHLTHICALCWLKALICHCRSRPRPHAHPEQAKTRVLHVYSNGLSATTPSPAATPTALAARGACCSCPTRVGAPQHSAGWRRRQRVVEFTRATPGPQRPATGPHVGRARDWARGAAHTSPHVIK